MSVPSTRIFYLAPDYDRPSWGLGLLYGQVRLLRDSGWRATVLHHKSPFRPDWIVTESPVRYLDDPVLALGEEDILVVPEALANDAFVQSFSGKKALMVQGTYPLLATISGREALGALGFHRVLAVMPHIAHLLERFFGTEAVVIPPFVAPYFFASSERLLGSRERRVLLHVKDDYEQSGFLDRRVLDTLWREGAPSGWTLDRFVDLTHQQVAERMASSAFLVNLNVLETFNATVPEAMASGALVLCYEAVGGRDFLRNGQNASVFSNNDVISLVERLFEQIGLWEAGDPALNEQRQQARRTAEQYTEADTRKVLSDFYSDWLG